MKSSVPTRKVLQELQTNQFEPTDGMSNTAMIIYDTIKPPLRGSDVLPNVPGNFKAGNRKRVGDGIIVKSSVEWRLAKQQHEAEAEKKRQEIQERKKKRMERKEALAEKKKMDTEKRVTAAGIKKNEKRPQGSPENPPKKRGRPRKIKTTESSQQGAEKIDEEDTDSGKIINRKSESLILKSDENSFAKSIETGLQKPPKNPPKKRGRPRKSNTSQKETEKIDGEDIDAEILIKRQKIDITEQVSRKLSNQSQTGDSERLKILKAEGEELRKENGKLCEKFSHVKKSIDNFNGDEKLKRERLEKLKILNCWHLTNDNLSQFVTKFTDLVNEKIHSYKKV